MIKNCIRRIVSLKLFYCNLLFLLLISCNSRNADVFVIDPLQFSNKKFTLSTIADDVSYVPLDNQFPLGLIYSFINNKNGIFISTKESGILHFDNNGRFIKVLAKKGKGPGEYRHGLLFAMDEENKNIYLVDSRSINVYHLDGRFLRSFSTEDFFDGAARDIVFFNSSLFLADYGELGTFKFNWVITDTLGNLLSWKYSNVNIPGFTFRGSTYRIGDKLYYYNWINDTIFSIYPDFSHEPGYFFAQGDFRWHNNLDLNKMIASNEMKSFFRPVYMFETNQFIFLRYAFRDKASILMIDKKNKDTYQGYVKNFGTAIENDFDGGLHFMSDSRLFSYYSNEHEYIITLIYPFEIKKHVISEAFKNSTPKNKEKKKQLEQLANSLNENDNPVLMLVKLKD